MLNKILNFVFYKTENGVIDIKPLPNRIIWLIFTVVLFNSCYQIFK